jgi:hypothetical protein
MSNLAIRIQTVYLGKTLGLIQPMPIKTGGPEHTPGPMLAAQHGHEDNASAAFRFSVAYLPVRLAVVFGLVKKAVLRRAKEKEIK